MWAPFVGYLDSMGGFYYSTIYAPAIQADNPSVPDCFSQRCHRCIHLCFLTRRICVLAGGLSSLIKVSSPRQARSHSFLLFHFNLFMCLLSSPLSSLLFSSVLYLLAAFLPSSSGPLACFEFKLQTQHTLLLHTTHYTLLPNHPNLLP